MHSVDEYNSIGSDIIGAAFDVRNNTGTGLREKYYESALAYEIEQRGHNVKRQVMVPAVYKGKIIDDSYMADIVVDDKIIIEVKAIGTMKEVESRQLFTYLRLSNFKLGYLINFGAKEFRTGRIDEELPYRKGIYRIVNNL